MQSISVACLLLFSLLALVHTGSGYECYACVGADTDEDFTMPFPILGLTVTKGCADPVDTSKIHARKECSSDNEACTKIKTDSDGIEVVARSCLSKSFCEASDKCYQCESDLCNASPNILPSTVLIGILSLVFAKLLL